MPDVGEVRYKAAVDNSGVDQSITSTEKKLGGLSSTFGKVSSGFKAVGSVGVSALKGIGTAFIGLSSAAGVGIAAVAKMGVEYNAQMDTYQTAFTTMLGDAEKAQRLTTELKDMAAATPLAMTDLADATQILLAFGSAADDIPDQLKRLGDVAQGNAQKLGTMATAFGRIQSNGYASLEEINMMIDQGFNPLNVIAEQTGETMGELRDRVSEGGVSFEEIAEALRIATDEGGQFFNAMENQSKTFEGQMSTLQDNLSALAGSLTEDLFAGLAEDALPQVNGWVDTLLDAAETQGVQGAVEAAGSVLSEALTALLDGAPQFVTTATDLIRSFLDGVEESGPDIADGAVEVILTLLTGFTDMIPDIISTAGVLIVSLIEGIADHFPEIVETAIELIGNLISGIIGAIPDVISSIGTLISRMIDSFANTDWRGLGRSVIQGIVNGIGSMASALWSAAKDIGRSLLNGVKDFLGIRSPSKVMRDEIGLNVGRGVAEGVEASASEVVASAKDVSGLLVRSFTADVKYDLPNMDEAARNLTAGISASVSGGTSIEVPLYLDGREIARASAWYMGEQLAWEERG